MAPLTKNDYLFAAAATTGDSFGTTPPLAKEVIDLCWPVGSIFISTSSTNPGLNFGIGTWTAFGAGRVLVGLDSGDTAFDSVEETGGAKTHTLTAAEIPAHSHGQQMQGGTTGANAGTNIMGSTATGGSLRTAGQSTLNNTGGGGAHNNLQPYIVVYMWKRTA